MDLRSFMWYLVSIRPAYRQAGFKVLITTNQKPFEQPTLWYLHKFIEIENQRVIK
jgi:hypothetical protein